MSDIDVATDMSENQAEAPPVAQEKMLPQSEVDKIVGAVRAKERAAVEAQYRNNQGMGGGQNAPAFDKDSLMEEMKSTWRSELEKQQQEAEEAQQRAKIDALAKDYLEKMKQGETLYEDFKEVTKGFSPAKYPQVTILAGQMENTPDIIYELKKNPSKLTHLHVLALTDPEAAQEEMTKLSKSIKRNEQGVANNTKSPQPLSRIKSSTQAGQDTGKRTVGDLRKLSKFRG